MTSAVSASRFVPALDEVMEDVVTFLHSNLETINKEDFLPSLLKIFMEVTGVITLDHRSDMFLFLSLDIFFVLITFIKRFDCLRPHLDKGSLAWQLLDASEKVMMMLYIQKKQQDKHGVWVTLFTKIFHNSHFV